MGRDPTCILWYAGSGLVLYPTLRRRGKERGRGLRSTLGKEYRFLRQLVRPLPGPGEARTEEARITRPRITEDF